MNLINGWVYINVPIRMFVANHSWNTHLLESVITKCNATSAVASTSMLDLRLVHLEAPSICSWQMGLRPPFSSSCHWKFRTFNKNTAFLPYIVEILVHLGLKHLPWRKVKGQGHSEICILMRFYIYSGIEKLFYGCSRISDDQHFKI